MDASAWTSRFLADLRRLDVPGTTRGILLACSGGPDSTALARLAVLARERAAGEGSPWPPVWLGHIHHGMRGASADEDAAFVRELAAALGLPFLEARVDVPAIARERKLSPEVAAREARYEAFARWASELPADAVLLGHTADDQAETVVLRILRRSGLRGLAGIPESRDLIPAVGAGPPPRVVRPLLAWKRAEILTVLEELGQPFRNDPTNRDLSIPRNRVRERILPLLRAEFPPAAEDALLEVARVAGNVVRDLDAMAREAWAGARRGLDSIEIDRRVLEALPPTVRLFLLERAALEAGPVRPPSLRRLEEVASWFDGTEGLSSDASGAGRKAADLGGGIRAELRRDALVLAAGRPREPSPPVPLPIPGAARWGDWEIRAEPVEGIEGIQRPPAGARDILLAAPGPFSEMVDRAALTGSFRVRGRRDGDRFHPLGAPGSKKLKEFLRERGVHPTARGRVPLVADEKGIVWVVGHRIGEPYRIRPESRSFVRLQASDHRHQDEPSSVVLKPKA
jgi:tRNA(Ile)-lysidine synthase